MLGRQSLTSCFSALNLPLLVVCYAACVGFKIDYNKGFFDALQADAGLEKVLERTRFNCCVIHK